MEKKPKFYLLISIGCGVCRHILGKSTHCTLRICFPPEVYIQLNLSQNDRILDLIKMKVFADEKKISSNEDLHLG